MKYAMIYPIMRKWGPVMCQTVPAFAGEMADSVRILCLFFCFLFVSLSL